jgi:hypothetical protein
MKWWSTLVFPLRMWRTHSWMLCRHSCRHFSARRARHACIRTFLLVACSVIAAAQQPPVPVWQMPSRGGITTAYRTPTVAPVHLENSRRLDSLFRDSRITLSLDDAIALALENNLDLELVRYAPRLAETDLLRAEAGSSLLGIPLSIREGPGGLGGPAAGPNGTLGGDDAPATRLDSGFQVAVLGQFPDGRLSARRPPGFAVFFL